MTDSALCWDIRPRLKEIDEGFDIDFNFQTETYSIYHNMYFFQSVPWREFTRKVLDEIRRKVWINRNGNIFKEVDEVNEKVEAQKEKDRMELSEAIAKDIRKPLLREIEGA